MIIRSSKIRVFPSRLPQRLKSTHSMWNGLVVITQDKGFLHKRISSTNNNYHPTSFYANVRVPLASKHRITFYRTVEFWSWNKS